MHLKELRKLNFLRSSIPGKLKKITIIKITTLLYFLFEQTYEFFDKKSYLT